MNEQAEPATKRGFRLWYLAVIILVTLIAGFLVYRRAGRTKLQAHLDALRAAGYPVDLVELDAWYAMPPAGENAAEYITEAIAQRKAPGTAEAEDQPWLRQDQFPPRTQPLSQESQTLIAQVLDDNQEPIALLEEAATFSTSRYPVDLTRGHATLLPHLGGFRNTLYLLCLKALFAAEQGQPAVAADALAAAFAVADSLAPEPITISQLVRLASQQIALSATEQVINRTALREDDLSRLDKILSAAYDPNAMIRGFVGERCMAIQALSRPQEAGLGLAPVVASEGPSRLDLRIAQTLGKVDHFLVEYIDQTNRQITAMRLPPQERQQALEEARPQADQLIEAHKKLSYFTPTLSRFVRNDLTNLARIRVGRVAVAVERYRVAQGQLPDQLDDLVPTYLESAPQDPYDGQPLRYKRLSPGFVVYSIGSDLSDDGGKERPPRKRGQPSEPLYDITFIVER